MTAIPRDVIAAAQAAQLKWSVPASVTIAQWAIESGYGRHMPAGSNNPFGIKAVAGQPSVAAMTTEVLHGRSVRMTQRFRKFATIAQAFDLHGQLLHDGRPYLAAMRLVGHPEDFANALTGVYATDPHYGRSLIAVMHANDLAKYDRAA